MKTALREREIPLQHGEGDVGAGRVPEASLTPRRKGAKKNRNRVHFASQRLGVRMFSPLDRSSDS
jgi:hypothetical protein